MSVLTAHAVSENSLDVYDAICTLTNFSIAENISIDKAKHLEAFTHKHEEYEFLIPLTTIPLLRYEKANYLGEFGYIYPVNPFVEHGLEFDLHSKVISITVDRLFLDGIKNKMGYENRYFYTRFAYDETIINLIRKFQNAFNNDAQDKEKVLNDCINKILSYLIDAGLKDNIDNRRPQKEYAKNIKKVLVYIEEHFAEPDLTISKLAEISNYSVGYFTRAFIRYMGDTPIMHLSKRRISEAKVLIRNKKLSLKEVADKVGYKNLSTFTEAFKRVVGCAPKDWKK